MWNGGDTRNSAPMSACRWISVRASDLRLGHEALRLLDDALRKCCHGCIVVVDYFSSALYDVDCRMKHEGHHMRHCAPAVCSSDVDYEASVALAESRTYERGGRTAIPRYGLPRHSYTGNIKSSINCMTLSYQGLDVPAARLVVEWGMMELTVCHVSLQRRREDDHLR